MGTGLELVLAPQNTNNIHSVISSHPNIVTIIKSKTFSPLENHGNPSTSPWRQAYYEYLQADKTIMYRDSKDISERHTNDTSEN